MNTGEAATRLGTTQKELRRFLRSDPSYTNAAHTTAGRYNFEESDMPGLIKRFTAWSSKNVNRKRPVRVAANTPRVDPEGKPGMPVSILKRPLLRSERERRDEESRARAARLDARLLANGTHLSQMRESVSG